MSKHRNLATAVAILAVALPVTAQEIIGLTHNLPLVVRQDVKTCKTLQCQVVNHQSRVSTFAGGTAYDGRTGAVWISNGNELEAVLPPSGLTRGCGPVCTKTKMPFPPSTTTAIACTGMAVLEAGTLVSGNPGPRGRLYFTYTTSQIGWVDTFGCSTSNFQYCDLGGVVGSGTNAQPIGGLACDDLQRLLFIGALHPTAGPTVYIVDADNPCKALPCRAPLTVNPNLCTNSSPLKFIAGLAYDSCTQTLYATDGNQVIWGSFIVTNTPTGTSCRWVHQGCCPKPSEEYTGLAMLPPPQTSDGRPCTATACNSCTPTAQTTGEPVMGNAAFSLDLVNAPSNTSIYALAIGLGACSPTGVGLGFCDAVRVNLSPPGPFVYFFAPTSTPAPSCNGGQKVPLPIPVTQALCNFTVSFQWVVGCNPSGAGISNCVTFRVSGI